MSFWTAMVIIAAIWGLVTVIRGHPRSALGHDPDEDGNLIGNRRTVDDRQTEGELKTEIMRLRERLEVLERITTDANSGEVRERRRLEAEIDSLRERE